ncbi:MAG: acyl-CoA thioesterase [Anaerolineales bacterium]|nr:acyl-CoA thioesterase [Anaerolineales bacterium]MCB0006370.1 acyl-CoA thioesterase [Anaerolineales bacterium]MCB0012948.1 acyl-CoA thioesterase [Anaerolineales bacterium]
MISRDQFLFFQPLTVQYAELDGQGIVFYGNYLTYYDIAINEYIRATGLDYAAWVAQTGLDFNVVKATVEYKTPLQLGADLAVGVELARSGRSSLTWQLAIFPAEGSEPMAIGEVIWVCADQSSFSSRPVPDEIRDRLQSLSRVINV